MHPSTRNERPYVSVLMAVFNPDPVYFPLAVRSILRQTFTDFELVIVEDPSPRSAATLLQGVDDPRIRYFGNRQRTSLVEQKNQGLAATRGEFVAIMDADDVAAPCRLRQQVSYLQAHPEVGVLGSQIALIDHSGQVRGHRQFPLHHAGILRALTRIVPLCHPSVMLRRDVLVDAGGYREPGYPAVEDYDLWSRLARRGVRFANFPRPLLHYRIHSDQMKTTHLKGIIRGILSIKQTYWRETMNLRAALRTWGEWLLLWLPPSLILRFLMQVHYRDHVVGKACCSEGHDEEPVGQAGRDLVQTQSPVGAQPARGLRHTGHATAAGELLSSSVASL